MARCYLTKNGQQVTRIMNAIKVLRQKDIAEEICESQQTVSYRIRNVYPVVIEDLLSILDMAGYEIKEKG